MSAIPRKRAEIHKIMGPLKVLLYMGDKAQKRNILSILKQCNVTNVPYFSIFCGLCELIVDRPTSKTRLIKEV